MATNPRIAPIERVTQRSWEDWLRFLDSVGAAGLDHGQIARRVEGELRAGVPSPGWWAQSVTVAYEQHVGRRLPGQRPDGTFETSVSRSTALGRDELMERWVRFADSDETVRGLVSGAARVSGTERRVTWRSSASDGSTVAVTSEPKKDGTASVVATHARLPSPEAHAGARETWTGILARFLEAAQQP